MIEYYIKTISEDYIDIVMGGVLLLHICGTPGGYTSIVFKTPVRGKHFDDKGYAELPEVVRGEVEARFRLVFSHGWRQESQRQDTLDYLCAHSITIPVERPDVIQEADRENPEY